MCRRVNEKSVELVYFHSMSGEIYELNLDAYYSLNEKLWKSYKLPSPQSIPVWSGECFTLKEKLSISGALANNNMLGRQFVNEYIVCLIFNMFPTTQLFMNTLKGRKEQKWKLIEFRIYEKKNIVRPSITDVQFNLDEYTQQK